MHTQLFPKFFNVFGGSFLWSLVSGLILAPISEICQKMDTKGSKVIFSYVLLVKLGIIGKKISQSHSIFSQEKKAGSYL